MKRKVVIGLSLFFGQWIAAHLFYAFATFTWSPFTEWEQVSRGIMLGVTLYLSVVTAWLVRGNTQ